ncbi:amp dependent CoA ligase [Mycena polygramma]|nr:amp dependent CoA ligase [Mycena polygramma]
MSAFSTTRTLPPVPDDLTVEQFILRDGGNETRPARPHSAPWLVADGTGRSLLLPEIQERTSNLANGLHSRFSIGEDDVVLIFSGNHIDYPICIWAVHRLCAIFTPCNPASTVSELTNQLRQTRATLIIANSQVLDVAVASAREAGIPQERVIVLEDVEGQHRGQFTISDLMAQGRTETPVLGRKLLPGEGRRKIAFLCTSSGTTGKPKIVAISHFAVLASVLQMATHKRVNEAYTSWEERRYRPGDVCLALLPFYHIYGLVAVIHFMLFSAQTVVVVPKFDFVGMLESIGRHKINQLMLVPPQVVLLCKEPIVQNYDLSSVRVILCAAAPLSVDLNAQLINLFPKAHIGQAYGSTECTGAVSMWSTRSKRGFNGGELLPNVVARVMKPDGTACGYNEPGEMLIKTPAMALGYFGDEKATKETFVDGWVRSGDQVMINEDHEVIYIDRLKEIMKVRGFQVAPAELEGCLLGHELVADVCVVGMADSFSGEVPVAFVAPTAAALATFQRDANAILKAKASLIEYVAKLKSPYKHLRRVEFVEEIPKSPSGKVLRRIIRERAKQLAVHPAKL